MSDAVLKPCPNCGRTVDANDIVWDCTVMNDDAHLECSGQRAVCCGGLENGKGCGHWGAWAETEAEAIAEWNRQPDQPGESR